MLGAILGAVGSVAGGLFGAKGASDAAEAQAAAVERAQQVSIEQAEKARNDALALFSPALSDFTKAIQLSIGELNTGQANVFDILNRSTNQASDILAQTGANVSNAILGNPISPIEYYNSNFAGQPGFAPVSQPTGQQPAQVGLPTQQATTPGAGLGLQPREVATGLTPPADYLLPPGVSREAFQEKLDILTGSPEFMGQNLSPEAIFRTAGLDAQADAEMQYLRSQGVNTGRDTATFMGSRPGVGLSEMASRGMQQQTYGDPNAQQGPTQQQTDLASLAGSVFDGNIPAGTRTVGGQQAPQQRFQTQIPRRTQSVDTTGTGFRGASQALASGYSDAVGALGGAGQRGLEQIAQGVQSATGRLDPYAQTGQEALGREAALSGALGPEAQQQAISQFQESPGQKYLRERQEQALLRNQAAIGGLGGGNVRTALQEQAMGIASTDQQRVLENLRNIAARGQTASTQQGGFDMSGGQLASNLEQNIGTGLANLATGYGSQQAGLAERTGLNLGQVQLGMGQGLAQNIGGLGTNLAGVTGGTSANVANLLASQGTGQAGLRTDLASLVSNLATGQGTNLANLQLQGGAANAAGVLGQNRAIQQGISGVAGSLGDYFGQSSVGQGNSQIAAPTQIYMDPRGRY